MKYIKAVSIWFLCLIFVGTVTAWSADFDCANGRHDYEVTIIQNATEDQEGIRQYTCSICGDSYQETIPALGHQWSAWIEDVPAGCISEGHRYRVCTKYPDHVHYEEEIIPATGKHDYQVQTIEPTCTEPGIKIYVCSLCGDTYTENYKEALGHDYVSVVTLEATEDTDGIRTYTCTRCGDTYTEVIPKLGHQETQSAASVETEMETETETEAMTVMTPSDAVGGDQFKGSGERVSAGPNTLDVVLPAASVGLTGWYTVLIYPYILVLLWARKKRKEAKEKMEQQRRQQQEEQK